MESATVRRALWRASLEEDFRRRFMQNLGISLAEEGFIMSDAEMAIMRDYWQALRGAGDREAAEKLRAWAHGYTR